MIENDRKALLVSLMGCEDKSLQIQSYFGRPDFRDGLVDRAWPMGSIWDFSVNITGEIKRWMVYYADFPYIIEVDRSGCVVDDPEVYRAVVKNSNGDLVRATDEEKEKIL